MKRIITPLIITLFIGCQPNSKNTEIEILDLSEKVLPITVTTVQELSQAIEIKTTGLVKSRSTTKYSFKIGGVIAGIYVDEGDKVKKGQLLASLRMEEIDAQYEQAEIGLIKSNRDFIRAQDLYKDSIATLESFQNAKTQLDIATRSLNQVKFNRSYAKIYAQNNGYVTIAMSNPGEVVAPGSPIIVTNDATTSQGYILECTVNDRQWAQVAIGDACQIKLDAYPDKEYVGAVVSKSMEADPVSGAFRIEVTLNNYRGELATGMFGKALITTKLSSTALVIPYEALVQANGDQGFVYRINESNEVEQIAVQIYEILPDKVLISQGISRGETIALGNSAFLTPSSTIKIID